tara:strand:+ start:72 stop:218 length:147 start_codon:yes stop_codon:yes gene_type:complete
MIKKLYDKLEHVLAIIWILPLLRYFVIAILIALIIGLIRGTSPLYNIF